MFIDDKELQRKLNAEFCAGSNKARQTIAYVHRYLASKEKDPQKKLWHEEESKRLLDDDRWNLVEL